MTLSFLSPSSCASILPTASPMIERYRSKGFPCCGGTRIGGWRRYSLISSKAFWHSSFHVCGSFFLRSLKMGSQVEVSLEMNRLIYCNRPKKPLISFSLLGGGIFDIALILYGSTSIPLSLTRKHCNFPAVTQSTLLWVQSEPILFNPLKEFPQVYGVATSILGFHYHIINFPIW